jgi:ATP diphosphatase
MNLLRRILGFGKHRLRPTRRGHSALDGVADAPSALRRALALQRRAADVGFDWPDADSVLIKLDEERGELERAMQGEGELDDELGDMFFTLVNLTRVLDQDPEVILNAASTKFTRRFKSMESLAAARGVALDEMSLEAMETLWTESKHAEKKRAP